MLLASWIRFRFILNSTVIAGLTALLFVLLWALAVQLDLSLERLPEWYREYREAKRREETLDRLGGLHSLNIQIKSRVTHELLQGQTSLRQAVGIFRYLYKAGPFDSTNWLRGASPEEKYGRNVLLWARTQQRYHPTRFSLGVVERLEAELQELLAGLGGWIPDVNPETIPELCSASR